MKTQLAATLIVLSFSYPWVPAKSQTVTALAIPTSAQLETEARQRAEEQKRQDEIDQQRRERLDVLLQPWLADAEPATDSDRSMIDTELIWPQPIFQKL